MCSLCDTFSAFFVKCIILSPIHWAIFLLILVHFYFIKPRIRPRISSYMTWQFCHFPLSWFTSPKKIRPWVLKLSFSARNSYNHGGWSWSEHFKEKLKEQGPKGVKDSSPKNAGCQDGQFGALELQRFTSGLHLGSISIFVRTPSQESFGLQAQWQKLRGYRAPNTAIWDP